VSRGLFDEMQQLYEERLEYQNQRIPPPWFEKLVYTTRKELGYIIKMLFDIEHEGLVAEDRADK
jgi:hypothetical protein